MPLKAVSIRIGGTVQGVGFRPFVYRTAVRHGITGTVCNDGRGVAVTAAGIPAAIDTFIDDLQSPPPLAVIRSFDVTDAGPAEPSGSFSIIASHGSPDISVDVAPDTATCPVCLKEMADPADRRYGHPLINCTDCGPRYTIITGLPYDRPGTTMAGFAMCPACKKEYDDPADRRYHAQPVCCPECGPRMSLLNGNGTPVETADPVAAAAGYMKDGNILAVKGLGGYHLACRADDDGVIDTLRQRKRREEKPFALMARDMTAVRKIAAAGKDEERLLAGTERPIVLLRKKRVDSGISDRVAPGLYQYGVMLPYTPVHHLLFRHLPDTRYLVMTSANFTDEPIIYRDEDAVGQLGAVADFLLLHDRAIHVRNDDSITRVMAGRPLLLRRARGYVPEPVPAPFDVSGIVAAGALLKSTVTVGRDNQCYVSQHIGDAENIETYESLEQITGHLARILDVTPEQYVCDLHPGYLSTRFAREQGVPVTQVQHHHAHAAACMAENGIAGKSLALVFDGTGYGTDGSIWGGELLLAGYDAFERLGHVQPFPLPGGDMAVKNPGRTAIGLLGAEAADILDWMDPAERGAVLQMAAAPGLCPQTSSMGRLFDALAALLDVCRVRTYEGQPAIMLEGIADPSVASGYGKFISDSDGTVLLDGAAVLKAAMTDVSSGTARDTVAGRFHRTIAGNALAMAAAAAGKTGITDVCLSGGVWQNLLLLEMFMKASEKTDLRIHTHRLVPPNDGCISYGQAVVAAALREKQGGN